MIRRDDVTQTEITSRLQDTRRIEEILVEVEKQVLLKAAQAGQKLPIWRNEQVVWVVPRIDPVSGQPVLDAPEGAP